MKRSILPQNQKKKKFRQIWAHYNNKFVELLDTLFMVLRCKNAQLSFLHVYHHVLMIWAWWVVCKFHPGGEGENKFRSGLGGLSANISRGVRTNLNYSGPGGLSANIIRAVGRK
jgi:hypothetical protein